MEGVRGTTLLDPSRRIHTSTERRWLGSRSYFCAGEGCGAPLRSTLVIVDGGSSTRACGRCLHGSPLMADEHSDTPRGIAAIGHNPAPVAART